MQLIVFIEFFTSAKRSCCAEVSFQPSSIGKEVTGVQDTYSQGIVECDVDVRKDLYVALSGGTVHQEISKCVTIELTALAPSTMKVKVVTTACTRRQMTSRTATRTGTCARQRQSTSAPDHQTRISRVEEDKQSTTLQQLRTSKGERDSRTESEQGIANAV